LHKDWAGNQFDQDRSRAGPIAGQGYRLAFHDEFGTLDANSSGAVSDSKRWGKLWFQPDWPAGSVYVRDSILHLVADTTNVSVSTRRATLDGSTSFWPRSDNAALYVEARMRWQSGTGTYPQFWMASMLQNFGHDCATRRPSGYEGLISRQPLLNPEVDVMEATPAPGTWSGTLHRNTGGAGGVADSYYYDALTNGAQDEFHTWAIRWGGTRLQRHAFVVSGRRLQMRTPGFDSTAMPMMLIPGSARRAGGAVNDTQFDWVRVWRTPTSR
jgi:hypothetical protein